jgi:hypothetical protein
MIRCFAPTFAMTAASLNATATRKMVPSDAGYIIASS